MRDSRPLPQREPGEPTAVAWTARWEGEVLQRPLLPGPL
jgi:hypothetical protein